jgi:hypothetical protein
MGYVRADLTVFRLLRSKNELEGTAYFELHPGEPPEPFACWLDGSAFMQDAGFDFFVGCFERANARFDYFAFEPFDEAAILCLEADLVRLTSTLKPGCAREEVFSRYSSLFSQSIWDEVPTEELRAAVATASSEIHTFVAGARLKGVRLWVMGM